MPCRYDPTPEEIAVSNAAVKERNRVETAARKKVLDKLTHDNDLYREIILHADETFTNFHAFLQESYPDLLKTIERDQIVHRKEDLKRLEKEFVKTKDTEKLQKVWNANPKKSLPQQLGFDPDDF